MVVALVVEGAVGVVRGGVVGVLRVVGLVALAGRRVAGGGGAGGGGRCTFTLLGRLRVEHRLDVARRRLVGVYEDAHGGGVYYNVRVVVVGGGGGCRERVGGGGGGDAVRVGGGVLGRRRREAEHGVRD